MKTLTAADGLDEARAKTYYTIAGVGGPLDQWLTGYGDLMEAEGIGRPQEWFQTSGVEVNVFARMTLGGQIHPQDLFQRDLRLLMFSLDGLDVGRLAIFKLRMQDRWFDDIISNMRVIRA